MLWWHISNTVIKIAIASSSTRQTVYSGDAAGGVTCAYTTSSVDTPTVDRLLAVVFKKAFLDKWPTLNAYMLSKSGSGDAVNDGNVGNVHHAATNVGVGGATAAAATWAQWTPAVLQNMKTTKSIISAIKKLKHDGLGIKILKTVKVFMVGNAHMFNADCQLRVLDVWSAIASPPVESSQVAEQAEPADGDDVCGDVGDDNKCPYKVIN